MELFNNPKFQCESKESDLQERYINDSQAERKIKHLLLAHSEASGCDRYDDKPLHYLDNFGYNSCFCNFTHPLIHYYLTLSENYERGNLPHSGCISDQSSRIIDIINLINFLKQDFQLKMQEEMQNKAKR